MYDFPLFIYCFNIDVTNKAALDSYDNIDTTRIGPVAAEMIFSLVAKIFSFYSYYSFSYVA